MAPERLVPSCGAQDGCRRVPLPQVAALGKVAGNGARAKDIKKGHLQAAAAAIRSGMPSVCSSVGFSGAIEAVLADLIGPKRRAAPRAVAVARFAGIQLAGRVVHKGQPRCKR